MIIAFWSSTQKELSAESCHLTGERDMYRNSKNLHIRMRRNCVYCPLRMVLLGVVVKLQKHFPVKQYLKIFNDSNNYPKISDLQPQSCNHEDHEEARRNTKSDHEAATTWGTRNLHISDCGLRNSD